MSRGIVSGEWGGRRKQSSILTTESRAVEERGLVSGKGVFGSRGTLGCGAREPVGIPGDEEERGRWVDVARVAVWWERKCELLGDVGGGGLRLK